jgi:electron transport complex protein RnfC
VQGLKSKYPQGGEKQLVQALLKREVPSGGLPIDVGVVVFNVGTAYAAYEAVNEKQAPDRTGGHRDRKIAGKTLQFPGTNRHPCLLPGGKGWRFARNTAKVVNGGPMMGKALASLDVPVVKGSSGILLIRENEAKRKEVQVCIRCTKCVKVCPMGLEPYLMMNLSEKNLFERMENGKGPGLY